MNKAIITTLLAGIIGCANAIAPPDNPQHYAQKWQQTNDHARTQITRAKKQIIAHYNHQGKPVAQPDAQGYYRQLLGYTAQGNAVVQDFHQATRTKQTDAFLIKKGADIRDFGNSVIQPDTRMKWYTRQGQLTQTATIGQNGLRGVARYDAENGALALWSDENPDTNIKHIKGYLDGKLLFESHFYPDGTRTADYFYPSGQKLRHNVFKQGKLHDEYWDENGQVANADNKDVIEEGFMASVNALRLMLKYLFDLD